MSRLLVAYLFIATLFACNSTENNNSTTSAETSSAFELKKEGDLIQVFSEGSNLALVTQNAQADHRPYLHPILAPNSTAELTQYSPGHHKHQTGLYWGFTRVNGTGMDEEGLRKWFYNPNKPEDVKEKIGRDYFHNPSNGYWERVSANVLKDEGETVKWQTVYNMLDAEGEAIMKETQTWTFFAKDGKHFLDLEWKGEAIIDITINEFSYGGMFLRMPWHKDIKGEAVNAARQKNEKAEGQPAMWVDVGMEIEGLDDWGHITIFEHPDNDGYPTKWRVDGQLGVGPTRAIAGDWQIKKGESKVFRHQVVAYTGDLNDVEMKEHWSDFIGDHGMYNAATLWGIAQEEGRLAKFLTPEEAIATSTIKDGYALNMYASEPMITQPMAFCWDDRGRMWIAENRDYENRQEGFANSGDSRILILEDTDNDGVADKKTVFLEGIPFPSAIAVGFDGLYLGAPPNFMFVPDRDKNDRADVKDIEILLTGWGIRDRHETINSLHWGPDGWLYGLEGFATPSVIRKPLGKGKMYKHGDEFPADLLEADGVHINGGVWRYHPTKHIFEAVAHGFSNPWGIDYDSKGQLFISACVIPHLFHVIPGGIYHRQGGRHFNPYVYEDIQTIVDHRHRSAHGGARVYLSDAFPDDQYGRIFMANIHEHAVLSDILKNNGSGYTASHGEDFMMANNAQWIGFSMELGPEGGLYVLDWHDADICGNDVVNKETGRVFRIMPEDNQAMDFPGRYEDLNTMSSKQLVDFQTNKSSWHARRARVILQARASKRALEEDAITRLNEIFKNEKNDDYRLRALWTKHVSNNLEEAELLSLLNDRDPYVRAWSIQFLGEDENLSKNALNQLAVLAQNESSAVVRMYLAGVLQRMEIDQRWAIADGLIQYAEDNNDPNIPYMLWFGIEPMVEANGSKALQLATRSKISSITNKIARRMVDANQIETLIAAMQGNVNKADLLNGLLAGIEGRSDLKEPSNWASLYPQLENDPQLAPLALEVAQQFGNAAAAEKMMALLEDSSAALDQRTAAINSLALQQRSELKDKLIELIEVPELKLEAIRAMAAYEDERFGELLLKKLSSFDLTEKQTAIQTLASRHTYGWQLAYAIKEGIVPKKEIPPYVAVQLRRVVGNGFVEIWGPIDEVSSDKQADYKKYMRLLSDANIAGADVNNGRFVYQKTCYICHQMYGEGGNMGPDLTGSNRANIPYLLSNIIDPSGEIQDDYKMIVITTTDGRNYAGNITSENDRSITLRTVTEEGVQINKSDIQSQEVTPKSMMPEGLLNSLTQQEILDLAAYLRTTEQVEMPEDF